MWANECTRPCLLTEYTCLFVKALYGWQKGGPFLGFAQALPAPIVWINLPEQAPTKARQCVLLITQLCARVHVDQQSAYTQLSPLYLLSILYVYWYPLCHSCDKLFQIIYCFSVLQATESWAGPLEQGWWSSYKHHYQEAFYYTN